MQYNFVILMCGLAALFSCKMRKSEVSEKKGIFASQDICVSANQSRLDEVERMLPVDFVVGFTGNARNELLQSLAALSNDALAWLIAQHSATGLTIKNDVTGMSVRGVVFFNENHTKATQFRIHPLLNTELRKNVILHELGHVLQLRASTPEFEARLKSVFENEGKSWFVGKYPQTNTIEYFAEAFNTFHCSPVSLQRMSEMLPATYALLSTSVSAPYWAKDMPAAQVNPKNIAVTERPFYKDRYRLGVTTEDLGPTGIGIRVTQVVPGSAADKAGFKVGDKLIRIAGFQNLLEPNDLELFIDGTTTGTAIITYVRPGLEAKEVDIQLDVLARATEATGTEPVDLGACIYTWVSKTCADYRTRLSCNKLGNSSTPNRWFGGKKCTTVFPR